jgi:hypothetical protein
MRIESAARTRYFIIVIFFCISFLSDNAMGQSEGEEQFLDFVETYDWDNDIVAQVLNYSEYSNETGFKESVIGNPFLIFGLAAEYAVTSDMDALHGAWYALDRERCIYTKMTYDEYELNRKTRLLDLNSIDPRNLTIKSKTKQGRTFYHVLNEETNLFILNLAEDKGRLERGWKLIYSKYCKGKKKAF